MVRGDINFFTPYSGKRKESFNKALYIYSLTGTVAVLIGITFAWNTANILLLDNKISETRAKLEEPSIKSKIIEWNNVNKNLDILRSYDTDLNELTNAIESRKIVSTNLLNSISSTLPTEVTLNGVNITNSEITMQATSSKREAIAEIQHNLKELPMVDDVYIGAITGEEKLTFDIKCVLKEVE